MADVTVEVRAAARTYPVWIGPGLLSRAAERLGSLLAGHKLALVTQRKLWAPLGKPLVAGLVAAGLPRPTVLEIPDGERAKTMAWAQRLCVRLARERFTRGDLVLALGGGVVGDLAGFVAAVFLRGIGHVQIPTTLLAQVDSSVGGKVAVNLPQGKNLVGSFHPPVAVLVDPLALGSLPARQLRAGAAEVVKYGLIGDPGFFARCVRELPRPTDWTPFVEASVAAKARVVELDETEQGPRRGLNLGHTLGHALEAAGGYSTLLHGEAVAIGTRYVYRLAAHLGACPQDAALEVDRFFVASGLAPPCPRHGFAKLAALMGRDKKADGRGVRWVLPTGIGSWRLAEGLDPGLLEQVYRELVDSDAARLGLETGVGSPAQSAPCESPPPRS